IAHGGDGGGSLRTPASCCGLVGLKPSRGRTPVGPDVGEAVFGLAVDSVLTRTVRDAAGALDTIRGAAQGDRFVAPPPKRPYVNEPATDPGRLRIALAVDGWFGRPVDPECAATARAAAEALADLGHVVTETCFRIDLERFVEAMEVPFAALQANTLDDLSAGLGRTPGAENLEALTLAFAESGRRLDYRDLHRSAATFNEVSRTAAAFFDDIDILLTPTLATPPVPLGRFDTTAATTPREWIARACEFLPYGMLFNVTGQPAIALPLGHTGDGLPIGVQAGARFGDEATLLRLAAQLERRLPWRHRTPKVHASR
ncbi:MAG: amidase, partial [Stackebrandtia sp.]